MTSTALHFHELDLSRQDDWLAFFDSDAFPDNHEWASCYCQCYYEDHRVVVWSARTARQNRDAACRRITARTMRGCLAYAGDRVVGWCNAAPRRLVHALDSEPLADAREVGVIVCFIVAPSWRGQGVARGLLQCACDSLAREGLRWVEANPRPDTDSVTENHYGPLSMYLKAGFDVVRSDPDGSVWVRRALA